MPGAETELLTEETSIPVLISLVDVQKQIVERERSTNEGAETIGDVGYFARLGNIALAYGETIAEQSGDESARPYYRAAGNFVLTALADASIIYKDAREELQNSESETEQKQLDSYARTVTALKVKYAVSILRMLESGEVDDLQRFYTLKDMSLNLLNEADAPGGEIIVGLDSIRQGLIAADPLTQSHQEAYAAENKKSNVVELLRARVANSIAKAA